MKIIPLQAMRPVLADKAAIRDAVSNALIAHSRGDVQHPSPTQMLFHDETEALRGDCHIKSAYAESLPYFTVKVATGFYSNNSRGLPVNNGMVLVMSSETGEPKMLLQDEGWITASRTAAAGVLAMSIRDREGEFTLGVLGTGLQARLQAAWAIALLPVSHVVIWGRSTERAQHLQVTLAKDHPEARCDVVNDVGALANRADVIVTTTPSVQPLLMVEHIQAHHHIVAVGADSPGKQELDSKVLAIADRIVTDDHSQCLAHGEFGAAVRAGVVENDVDVSLGSVLAGEVLTNRTNGPTVVDLTGLGVQDLAVASLMMERLSTQQ
ncbi:MAG: ornithine cyclodeaminase family protein [Pseudomonadota bacterium]